MAAEHHKPSLVVCSVQNSGCRPVVHVDMCTLTSADRTGDIRRTVGVVCLWCDGSSAVLLYSAIKCVSAPDEVSVKLFVPEHHFLCLEHVCSVRSVRQLPVMKLLVENKLNEKTSVVFTCASAVSCSEPGHAQVRVRRQRETNTRCRNVTMS